MEEAVGGGEETMDTDVHSTFPGKSGPKILNYFSKKVQQYYLCSELFTK